MFPGLALSRQPGSWVRRLGRRHHVAAARCYHFSVTRESPESIKPGWWRPSTAWTLLIALAIVCVAAVTLLTLGRTPWGPGGVPGLWTQDAWARHTSQRLADPYSFTHVIHGIGLYALLSLLTGTLSLRVRFLVAIALESAWEVFENTDFVIRHYREVTASLDYYGDSVLNSVGDILAAAVGFSLAAFLPVRVTAILVLTIEVVLLLWIRDSFFLNILMLAVPSEAIREWQLGL